MSRGRRCRNPNLIPPLIQRVKFLRTPSLAHFHSQSSTTLKFVLVEYALMQSDPSNTLLIYSRTGRLSAPDTVSINYRGSFSSHRKLSREWKSPAALSDPSRGPFLGSSFDMQEKKESPPINHSVLSQAA